MTHHKILIVGGGTAGIATAAALQKEMMEPDVAIIEPSDTHYYQPGWTFVGAGVMKADATGKPMREVIPDPARCQLDY